MKNPIPYDPADAAGFAIFGKSGLSSAFLTATQHATPRVFMRPEP
jgi:hypothetical protein